MFVFLKRGYNKKPCCDNLQSHSSDGNSSTQEFNSVLQKENRLLKRHLNQLEDRDGVEEENKFRTFI